MANFFPRLTLVGVFLTFAGGVMAEEVPNVAQQQAEAAMERAQHHLGEAFKALQEAGGLLYQDNVPGLRDKSFSIMEGLMGEGQKMLQELQKQLPKQFPTPSAPVPPSPDTPPAAPSDGPRDRYI